MKVTITKAAKMANVSRNTIYNDIENGVLSYTANARNKKLIDVAELARVYDAISLDDAPKAKTLADVQKRTDTPRSQVKSDISAQVMQARLEAAETALNKEKEERQRERDSYEDQLEKTQSTLEKLQQTHGQTVALLEHKAENSSSDWENSIKALENRIANQEKVAIEHDTRQQKLLEENLRIKRAFTKQKRALEAEKSKTVWQKIFGTGTKTG